MAKSKFVLTSSLVKVEPEPEEAVAPVVEKPVVNLISVPIEKPVVKPEPVIETRPEKIQTNIKLTKDIKQDFQVWCFKNGTTMSDILEKMIVDILKEKKE